MSRRWQTISRIDHLPGAGRRRTRAAGTPCSSFRKRASVPRNISRWPVRSLPSSEVTMDGSERTGHLEILRGTEARLRKELQGVPAALVRRRPAPGKWSILEIVCHLRDMERDAYLGRYRRILQEENPSLPNLEGDVLALERG